jgi:hypothetical protein
MQDRMTRPSPDVMQHCTFPYQIHVNKGIALSIFQCNVVHGLAVSQNFFTASCITQQLLIFFFLSVRHDPGIF